MSYNDEQNEFAAPLDPLNRKVSSLLPRFYRTDSNKKFVHATLDQLLKPGTVKKVNGYIGRPYSKATTATDIFLNAPSTDRQDYQLEPSLVIKDELGNVVFNKDYIDHINHISVYGGITNNHARINKEEFYSWDPKIDWDKFVNFQQYYWLPYGPDIINVFGQQKEIQSEYSVNLVDEDDNYAYLFSPDGLTRNPILKLYRGQTYRFNISAQGQPFSIKTERVAGTLSRYNNGVSQQAVQDSTIIFEVPLDAPNVLFYVSENDVNTGGVLQIQDIEENSEINIDEEILGKTSYTMGNGYSLSNGMKVRFVGEVTPISYKSGYWYVEGVGNKIKLIPDTDLEIISGYSQEKSVLFDDTAFDQLPWDDASAFAGTKDYITVNRSSMDRNPWSRYNRWFHKDIIEISAEINKTPANFDQSARAKRPIIEFQAGLKLFNFGTTAKKNVDLIDTFTTDVFSTIEGSIGYNVDGVDLTDGHRLLVAADTDVRVVGRIFEVKFINVQVGNIRQNQITLVEVNDTEPVLNETVLIKLGSNQGKMYWFDGTKWKLGQEKTSVNQDILFDIVDSTGTSISDINTYPGSSFLGTKVFSYSRGTTGNDNELGFPLTYRNINNIGDIVFDYNFDVDTFSYKVDAELITSSISKFYLEIFNGNREYVNGWTTAYTDKFQRAIRVYKGSEQNNNFVLDIYDNKDDLLDLKFNVYKNGIRLNPVDYSVSENLKYKVIILNSNLKETDILTVKSLAAQAKNSNGHYELPISLQNNPLNEKVTGFTLGQVIDHVDSIVSNVDTFNGNFPGDGNLRDLGDVSKYGTRFVQHSGPLINSLLHLGSKTSNVLKGLEAAKNDYGKFKRNFLMVAESLGLDESPKKFVDIILSEINKSKSNSEKYFLSDMIPYRADKVYDFEVLDSDIKTYPLSFIFNLNSLSNQAVLVYLNDNQLIYEKDYVFNSEGFVEILAPINVGDIIKLVEYETTDGCFVPATPTKLGLYPKFIPEIYVDDTYIEPVTVIQGHDGSITIGYNDYRDQLLLELEKRIFNNIKVSYDPTILDIYELIPGYSRATDYSRAEFLDILSIKFYQWTTLLDVNISINDFFDRLNSFTFNYSDQTLPDGSSSPGFWRGIYKWLLDTDRPHTHPWEILGFTIEPQWWQEVYGPRPYTSNNLILWEDLQEGIVREPGIPVRRLEKFARPGLMSRIPVDEYGNLISPLISNSVFGLIQVDSNSDFVFGDGSPTETAWNRSSYYPFSLIETAILMHPNKVLGLLLDKSRILKNLTGQLVYADTNLRIQLKDLVLPSTTFSLERKQTAGLVNYIVDDLTGPSVNNYNSYKKNLQNLNCYLTSKLGGFTSKEKFRLLLDSKSPSSSSNIFIPDENYDVFLNTSSPVLKVNYSGIIIQKFADGYEVRGYTFNEPYFDFYRPVGTGLTINVGGISEAYIRWDANQIYRALSIVEYNNQFYRCIVSHTSTDTFDETKFTRLPALPLTGGKNIVIRKKFENTLTRIPYGTRFADYQDVVDFLLGYEQHLKTLGFIFDEFNRENNTISNWQTSAKEFAFWLTQNWAVGSVICLSPAANKITLQTFQTDVNNIFDTFYSYLILQSNGQPLATEFVNTSREDGAYSLKPKNTGQGIYAATFYLIQKEHVLLLDNITFFNDVIYDPQPGYRQERIKALGYISDNWDGTFSVPGFIYDQAEIKVWETWTDYNLGDVVQYKQFYFTAKSFIPGSLDFDNNQWNILTEKPVKGLLPNWDYKSEQFNDFYDLNSDNFDTNQQKIAQHLVGYQKRTYLENIVKDDVSQFKFYQGMIIEKGTENVLNKLFDVLSADNQESLTLDEEWAVRVGQYGGSAAFEEIEFTLDETQFKIDPQPIELTTIKTTEIPDFVIRQSADDLYLKPTNFKYDFWPTVTDPKLFLRSAGYVRYDDVKINVDTLDDLLTLSNTDLVDGDYVWAAFEGINWNVYRYTYSNIKIDNVVINNQTKLVEVVFDSQPNIVVGEIISLTNIEELAGFYKVKNVAGSTIYLENTLKATNVTFQGLPLLFKFISARIDNFDNTNNFLPSNLKENELVWADSNENNKWAVWQNSPVFSSSEFGRGFPTSNENFGTSFSINGRGNKAAIANSNQEVAIFELDTNGNWVQKQTITGIPGLTSNTGSFGRSVTLSKDSRWLFVSEPLASNVKTLYKGNIVVGDTYNMGDIITSGYVHWQAQHQVGADSSLITEFADDWEQVRLIEATNLGLASNEINQGMVYIYQKDEAGTYLLNHIIVSPYPASNEQFGSKIKVTENNGEYLAVISSPGYNNDQGRLYFFRYGDVSVDSGFEWHMDYNRSYRGHHDPQRVYYSGDVVFYQQKLYQAVSEVPMDPFENNISLWQELSDTNIQCFVPKQITTLEQDDNVIEDDSSLILRNEYVENVFSGDKYGYDFDLTANGDTLVVSAPYGDNIIDENFRGPYRSDIAYTIGDVVFYNGQYWKWVGNNPLEDSSNVDSTFDFTPAGPFNYFVWTVIDSSISNKGKVFVYSYDGDNFDLTDTISGKSLGSDQELRFGESVTLSSIGTSLAISGAFYSNSEANQGAVFVLDKNNNTYLLSQKIERKHAEESEKFGHSVCFLNDNKSLVIFSKNGDSKIFTTFNLGGTTTFDKNVLNFVETAIDSGRIDIYDRYINNYIFGESLPITYNDSSLSTYVEIINDQYGSGIQTSSNAIFVSAPFANYEGLIKSGTVLTYKKKDSTYSWTKKYQQIDYVDIDKIKKIYLYDAKNNSLVTYLDCIDPLRGRIAGAADQEIKFKTYYDPAVYSQGTSALTVDDGANWTDNHVGMLWWDLTKAKFLDSSDSNVVYRNSIWNTLYETASIDVYEWVKSKYLPTKWNSLADTEEGLAQGISGQTKYGDTVYSTKRKYDSQTKTFKLTYYFWVKNKTTVPNVNGRTLSAASISSLISDPKSQGYKFISFTGPSSFSLFNCRNQLNDSNVKLNVQYWLREKDATNIHSQWKIIRQDADCIVPSTIEDKFIDSLVGKDKNNRLVPDINLPFKKKYGIEFRPRQGMFVYRYEALKQILEKTNDILNNLLIVDDFDLTDLQQSEEFPLASRGKYDKVIDIEEELRFISTSVLRPATLTPVLQDGKIIDAVITNPGIGYVNAPYVTVTGSGIDAVVKTIIDAQGRVIGVTVINPGKGYTSSTKFSVRPYSVLVKSDSDALNTWSIYAYDNTSQVWSRVKSQSYNVSNFWKYKDWYATGYNQFTKIDYSIDQTYQIPALNTDIGETVKVLSVGTGGWLLLEKFANSNSQDYTLSYKVIGRQNGTIEFLDSLWKVKGSLLTFDGSLYDNDTYDNSATIELRIILDTLKNKLFVDNYRQYWLDILFVGFRYALSEQNYLDWLIKTSFIKATHNAGELKQKVNYNNDNLENYEDYINEVKPYRTKVREYVSAYNKLDLSRSMVSDFDLPQVIDVNGKITPLDVIVYDNAIVSNSTEVTEYPWRNWYDNVGFKIREIQIVDGGAGYIRPPVVRITGTGTGAEAIAYVASGKVNRIKILNAGTGYLSAPTIILDGGLQDGGTPGRAVAIIESEVVRSMHVSIKFDRTNKNYYITELTETETFIGSGSLKQFVLKWPADPKVGKSTISVGGQELLRETFTLTKKSSVSRGYTYYYSVLTLDEAPANGESVVVTYYKDISLLSAVDRIQYFYNPTTGQLGKDLGQLLTGVDYGGVSVTGLGFGAGAGWDALPWFSDQWDGFDAAFDDYIITVADSTYEYTLPYTPELGQEINIYVNGRRIDDPYFNLYDGSTVQPNGRRLPQDWVVMQTWIGDGVTNVINLPNLTDPYPININEGDKVIFRKSTSDGSFLPNENEYDTILQGGDIAYSTATGVQPDDIILDGDDFVSPTSSHGPEELVPGQILDTVAIKVFALPKNGSARIKWANYKANGTDSNFKITQYPNSKQAIAVLVDGIIKEVNSDYTIDWQNNEIILAAAPTIDQVVSVSSWGFNGQGVLDLDYFVGDGSTVEFITNASWTDGATSMVLVNGETINYDLFQTDITYDRAYRVGIRFVTPPPAGSIVNYLIQSPVYSDDSTLLSTTSVVKSETIVADGSTLTYSLSNNLGFNEIYENNVIVRVGQTILRGPSSEYFTLANNVLTYSLPQHKYAPYSFSPFNIRVYLNGVELIVGSEYIFDFGGVAVELTESKYIDGAKLVVMNNIDAEYGMTSNSITFNSSYTAGTEIEVTSFYNHDIVDIQRKEDTITSAISLTAGTVDYFTFKDKENGMFVLDRPTLSDDYVWVVKNGTLLAHSIDWKLLEDKQTLQVMNVSAADKISIIGYSPDVITNQYAYMQFKDMLNRTHYKRLNKNKQTFITNDLGQFDISITVDNGEVLDEPNPESNLPGVVYINGERIEYFSKNGNTISRLRRGTLGTGIPTIHNSGTLIINIGSAETIPYKDEFIVETFVATDSSNLLYLNYTPEAEIGTIDDGSTPYNGWYRDTIPDNYGQCNSVEVFVAGYRLKKTPFKLHDISIHGESPEGDVQYEAEFSVDGSSQTLRLTTPAPDDTKIVVVKKVGKIWNDFNTSLVESNNNIATFIKAAPGIWPL